MSDPSDRELLDLAGELLDEEAQLSEGFVDIVLAGYDLTVEEPTDALLVEDTDRDRDLVAVRSEDLGARLIAFASEDIRIECEILPDSDEISGSVDPPTGGTIVLDQDGRSSSWPVDQNGEFVLRLGSSAPFRLRYLPRAGAVTTSDWVTP